MAEQQGLVMKYFVLRPHGIDAHAKASRKAMMTYAIEIREKNEKLANDLVEWSGREYKEAVLELIRLSGLCIICHTNPVDTAAGYDTCESCLKKI